MLVMIKESTNQPTRPMILTRTLHLMNTRDGDDCRWS